MVIFLVLLTEEIRSRIAVVKKKKISLVPALRKIRFLQNNEPKTKMDSFATDGFHLDFVQYILRMEELSCVSCLFKSPFKLSFSHSFLTIHIGMETWPHTQYVRDPSPHPARFVEFVFLFVEFFM